MLTYKSSITLSEYLKIFSRLSGNFIKNKKDDKELILSTMNETFPSSLRFDGGAHIANGAFIENIFRKKGYENILNAEIESVIPIEAFSHDYPNNKYFIDGDKIFIDNDGFAYRKIYTLTKVEFEKLDTVYEIRLKNNNFASRIKEEASPLFSKIRIYEFIDYINDAHETNAKFVIIDAQKANAPIHILDSIKSLEERFESDLERFIFHIVKATSTDDSNPLYFIYY